jgi:hypothetical protein
VPFDRLDHPQEITHRRERRISVTGEMMQQSEVIKIFRG